MTKQYGVWCEPKDGLENGKWDHRIPLNKDVCERFAERWNKELPDFTHEVRERPVKQ